jgi:hypothetical protein
MNRLGNTFASSVFAIAISASLAACGEGSHSRSVPPPVPSAIAAPEYSGPLADATLTITIPVPTTSSSTRRPAYVSSSTSKIVFTLNTTTNPNMTPAQVTAFNTSQLGAKAVTLGSATCPGSGPWTCTFTIKLPPGSDNITVSAQDAANNILSQQKSSLNVAAGTANSFGIILDANANTMTIGASSGYCAGTFNVSAGQTVATVGSSGVTFNVSYADLAGKTVIGPGLPLLTVNGFTDDNAGAGHPNAATGLNVKVNQATQTFTLANANGSGSAPVTVTATSTQSGADGLSFNKSLGFTMQAGAGPPSTFLASAEQFVNTSGVVTSGQIKFYTLSLGASDTFNAYSTPQLAVQPPPSSGNYQFSDVDFPNDLLFDGNGDLLIANGGGSVSGVDFGNFACVPAGAITTGANAATVLTANMNDPISLAFSNPLPPANGGVSGDGSVALLNGGNAPTYLQAEFLLNGTYSAAPTTRDTPYASYSGDGVYPNIVALPATGRDPAGSYAFVVSNAVYTGNHIFIKHPDGSQLEFPQDTSDTDPQIAYDAANNQIVALNRDNPSVQAHLTFWSVATMTKVKDIILDNNGFGVAIGIGPVAVSPDGHVAFVESWFGTPVVSVLDNTAARAKVLNYLDFGATTTPGGASYTYGGAGGGANVVRDLKWLNNSKLLIGLLSQSGWVYTSANGLYIFDITQTQAQGGFDGNGTAEPTPTMKKTGFQLMTNTAARGVAYKP